METPRDEERTRVLIVDDHEDNIELLRARLDSWGFATESAADGEEALRLIEASPPDLILLDVMMPKIDGMEVARRVKGNRALPFIPIIMQTALDATENKVEGLEAGADDYITKPIDFAELKARLNSMLRIKRLQDALEERERQLLEANERLRYMSQTDALTGLDNRRHLEERIDEMFEHARRLNEPFSCVMCDLDRFKSVNDTYGHQAGDAVLKQFARILRNEVREIDRVGRYGGEEFMLLLPGTVLDAAVTFAERVRKEVEGHTFTFDGTQICRTASFGVSAWPHPRIGNCDVLVRAADDALYVAKETGRNRVIRFDSDEFNEHLAADDGPDRPRDAITTPRVADEGIRWER
ncbi:MAG TPA: diguanylate cyclase [Gemmatimonadaceae bacterium]|jgi:two-component system cell cycle response regulator|nr:diguanylate cyclase [Gemmatimonadaceae bacterium]